MRKLVASLFGAALLVGVVAVPAFAETITNTTAQVSVDVPAGWTATKGKDDTLTLADKAQDCAVAFALTDSDDLKSASKRLGKYLADKIPDLKIVKEDKVTVNGMPGVKIVGDGHLNDSKKTDVDLAVVILDTPNPKKDLFVIALAEDSVLSAHKAEIDSVFQSLKPTK